jgi:hypothetical protein
METAEKHVYLPVPTESRDIDGTYLKGVSGNPAGRPPGSRNIQRQLEDAVREYVVHPDRIRRVRKVIDRLLQKAEDGHVGAAKLLLDKIVPNATPEGEDEKDANRNTYVFRIENATFAAPKPPTQAIEAEVVDIKEESN